MSNPGPGLLIAPGRGRSGEVGAGGPRAPEVRHGPRETELEGPWTVRVLVHSSPLVLDCIPVASPSMMVPPHRSSGARSPRRCRLDEAQRWSRTSMRRRAQEWGGGRGDASAVQEVGLAEAPEAPEARVPPGGDLRGLGPAVDGLAQVRVACKPVNEAVGSPGEAARVERA